MVSIFGHLLVGWLAIGMAHAQESEQSGGEEGASEGAGINTMLDAIPTIEAPKTAEEDEPKVFQPLDYRSYNRLCSKAVMPHFKAPKSVVKRQPDIELELLVGVDLDGAVTAVTAGRRSGVTSFDKAALKALNKVAALPAPPKGWNVEKDRVILTFRAR